MYTAVEAIRNRYRRMEQSEKEVMNISTYNDNPRRNQEGYLDPTAFEALRNIEEEDNRFHRLLHTLFYICELAGFEIEGRIVLLDKKTGRIWR